MTITSASDARAASASLPSVDGVRLLHWPADDTTRAELAGLGFPRILLVPAHAAPPEHWDELEDWVRLPLDPDELRQRARTLRRRARSAERPWIDEDGLLRAGDAWLDLPPGQRVVVEVLVERFGEIVAADELARRYLDAGGSARQSARKTMIVRIRRRLAGVGLELHNVRESGYLLGWADDPGATRASDTCVAS